MQPVRTFRSTFPKQDKKASSYFFYHKNLIEYRTLCVTLATTPSSGDPGSESWFVDALKLLRREIYTKTWGPFSFL